MVDRADDPDDRSQPEQLGRRLGGELGERAAEGLVRVWRVFGEWDRAGHEGEGLRERRKRETRALISDAATALFRLRGFDGVTIAEIAKRVGVSEKTIYNYFPTKESLVFDRADEQLLRLTAAVRDRPEGVSPTAAFVAALKREFQQLNELVADAGSEVLLSFSRMVHETPALRAAWGEHSFRMVEALAATLAKEFGVDPRDPEPRVTARGLVGLFELFYDSTLRRLADGLGPDAIAPAVAADLERGARLLETGLWSLELLLEGRRTKRQLRDAAVAADRAGQQVLSTLRDAKQAFEQIRDEARAEGRDPD